MANPGLSFYRYAPLPLYGLLRMAAALSPFGRAELRQRLAVDLPAPSQRTVWFHAASVGEISTVAPLVVEIGQRFPEHRLIVTTMTANGMKRAQSLLEAATVRLLPLDFFPAMRRFIRALKPETVVIGETEIWPNLVIEAHRAGARIALVNGRISARSFSWYRAIKPVMADVLALFDCFLMRTSDDARRIELLGADSSRVHVVGNTKFDVLPKPMSPETRHQIRAKLGIQHDRPVITLGSVRQGEFELLLDALKPVIETLGALVVVAPRHLNILSTIREQIGTAGYTFEEIDISNPFGSGKAGSLDFLLVAQMGRLLEMYAIADIAIVGGTFRPFGGHNPLEPVSQGAVTIVGPFTQNIDDDIR
ncbi:MAG TPA: hypothetical protein ENI46_00135, partial [Firmicutes bacterium]|nr:hypothetical protein [Bacillota bacterium]